MKRIWTVEGRPGFFGRRRDQKIAEFNEKHGEGKWRLAWLFDDIPFSFEDACKSFYEKSYRLWLKLHPANLDFICSFGECIDNAETNVNSGCDYTKQEAFSTHIQDIAVRNCLKSLGRKFEGSKDKILVIRGHDSEGHRFNPGNIPFYQPEMIIEPYLNPSWAKVDSVESFWQSNKVLQVEK